MSVFTGPVHAFAETMLFSYTKCTCSHLWPLHRGQELCPRFFFRTRCLGVIEYLYSQSGQRHHAFAELDGSISSGNIPIIIQIWFNLVRNNIGYACCHPLSFPRSDLVGLLDSYSSSGTQIRAFVGQVRTHAGSYPYFTRSAHPTHLFILPSRP